MEKTLPYLLQRQCCTCSCKTTDKMPLILRTARNVRQKLPDDGSTASTATLKFLLVISWPNLSMKVDFPAPGGPDRPIRNELTKTFALKARVRIQKPVVTCIPGKFSVTNCARLPNYFKINYNIILRPI
jgi:hypothetical protein